jgi:signal transduction histidine kinase
MPYEPKTLKLAELVLLNTALLAERANQKGIKLIAAVPPDLSVTADERMLNSVLRNLLANAIKYSGKGQTVTIEAAQSSDGSTTVKVSDEGIGMEKEILDRLFEIGEQQGQKGTDDEPGTGLGLVLCKEFVVRHGGQIEAVSRKGAGSTFIFTLQH